MEAIISISSSTGSTRNYTAVGGQHDVLRTFGQGLCVDAQEGGQRIKNSSQNLSGRTHTIFCSSYAPEGSRQLLHICIERLVTLYDILSIIGSSLILVRDRVGQTRCTILHGRHTIGKLCVGDGILLSVLRQIGLVGRNLELAFIGVCTSYQLILLIHHRLHGEHTDFVVLSEHPLPASGALGSPGVVTLDLQHTHTGRVKAIVVSGQCGNHVRIAENGAVAKTEVIRAACQC